MTVCMIYTASSWLTELSQLIYLLSPLSYSSSPSTLSVCMLRWLQTLGADEVCGESAFCCLLYFCCDANWKRWLQQNLGSFQCLVVITINTRISNFKAHLLCYFFQQEEMSPYSLLTVRIIKLRNAHQADFCKYQIFLLTLYSSKITGSAPACASHCTNAKHRNHTS